MANPRSGVVGAASSAFAKLRESRPFLDHLIQAGKRYGADQGNNLAAAVTYFSFLSLFPVLLLGISILGFVLNGHPDLIKQVTDNISGAFPGDTSKVINGAINNRTAVGLTGLVGLLYSGLGWIDNLRTAIRTVWHQNVKAGNFVKAKLNDLLILVGLGLAFGVTIAVSGIGNAATGWVAKLLSLDGVPGMTLLLKLITIVIAMAADVVVFLWLFTRLPKVQSPWRQVIKGAVFASVGFEILKIIGAYYIQRTTAHGQATYGSIAVTLGTLVWINLVARFVIFSAVWTVTAPYDDDIRPSGTADPEAARAADIPTEFAEEDGADARQVDDSPAPLTPALQGSPGVGFGGADEDNPTGRRKGGSGSAGSAGSGKGGGGSRGRDDDSSDRRAKQGRSSPEPRRASGAPRQDAGRHIRPVDPVLPGGSTEGAGGRVPAGALVVGAVIARLFGSKPARDSRTEPESGDRNPR